MSPSATVFAPATVANVAVGFDLLGFALSGVGDTVTVSRREPGEGDPITLSVGASEIVVPSEPGRNTAAVALEALRRDLGLADRFHIELRKGIPLGSGMGGSAASAVGAVVAANALLASSLPRERLLGYAIEGERSASGAAHPDNAAPCLYGGLTLTLTRPRLEVLSIPVPGSIHCILVHPHMELETRRAREVLSPTLALATHVEQSGHLAGFLAACFRGNTALIGRHLRDVVIEPQRASLVPGFEQVQRAAREAGALGCSLSGSGPSLFAWAEGPQIIGEVRIAMQQAFENEGLASDTWISPVDAPGATLVT
jgi:homoserine kinase